MVGYDSPHNITFNNELSPDELGYTWGQWRDMSDAERGDILRNYMFELVEVFVVDQEDEN
jgi:hypothetical protein